MDKPHATLLNFTANSYHWGCYGTSMEIYLTLLERGFYIDLFDVSDTHAIGPTPTISDEFVNADFFDRFRQRNEKLVRTLMATDLVIVNGEGTLHRNGNGAINLLYIMLIAKLFLKKRVHLINHSFYPNGDASVGPLDVLYGTVAQVLDKVVPREIASAAVLHRLEVVVTQGFDCLPRFIDRHGLTHTHAGGDGILISGGVALSTNDLTKMAEALAPFARAGHPIRFITGAKALPAQEDGRQFAKLKEHLPTLGLASATSMSDWLQLFRCADVFVSGRFHHSLAAACLGVPFLAFSSNTPKIEATMAMLGGPPPVTPSIDFTQDRISSFLDDALRSKAPSVHRDAVVEAIGLAARNFEGI